MRLVLLHSVEAFNATTLAATGGTRCDRARIGYNQAMHIDGLVLRIRRLPLAKRKKLDEIVRSLESQPETGSSTTAADSAPSVALRSVRGLLRDLGPAPSDKEIDEARREVWLLSRWREVQQGEKSRRSEEMPGESGQDKR